MFFIIVVVSVLGGGLWLLEFVFAKLEERDYVTGKRERRSEPR